MTTECDQKISLIKLEQTLAKECWYKKKQKKIVAIPGKRMKVWKNVHGKKYCENG